MAKETQPKPHKPPKFKAGQIEAHPLEMREKAYQLSKSGMSHADVGVALGISAWTVSGWARRFKWRERKFAEGAGRTGTSPNVAKAQISKAESLGDKQTDYEAQMQREAMRLPALMAQMTDQELLKAAQSIVKLDAVARKALKLEENRPTVTVNIGLLAGTEGKRLTGGLTVSNLSDESPASLVEATGMKPVLDSKEQPAIEIEASVSHVAP